jgi:multidrug efflux pump subunit AcrB
VSRQSRSAAARIDVEIDQQRLQRVNLNVADVTKRLADENVSVSGGESKMDRSVYAHGQSVRQPRQMRNLLIKVDAGVPVRRCR